jgi:hypothetical protein
MGAIAFFTLIRPNINMATFDTVKDHLGALGIMYMTITPVIVKPETKKQNKSRPKIEQEE